jgi:surface protein
MFGFKNTHILVSLFLVLNSNHETHRASSNFSFDGTTCICTTAGIGDSAILNIDGTDYTFTKRTKAQLEALIAADENDPEIRFTCTSGITDMSFLFQNASDFNQDISWWDTSNVTNMRNMFDGASSFNQPLNDWNVSAVVTMQRMFRDAISFDHPLDNWDVSNVTNMRSMFSTLSTSDPPMFFNQNINSWDVSNVNDTSFMFSNAVLFNQPLNNWDVSSAANMSYMFRKAASFNHNIDNWDVSNVTDMSYMFYEAVSFNQPLNNWDVSNVANMQAMFSSDLSTMAFDQNLSNWDISSVTDMSYMFFNATAFNQPLNNWDVSNVTNMQGMFASFSSTMVFDQPLNNWDVSNVTDMSFMFTLAVDFDQSLNNWIVSSVTDMSFLFFSADAFNQPLNDWDVSSVINMESMFPYASSFDQNLQNWDVSNVVNMDGMFYDATSFNNDLSIWCVNQISSEPDFFSDLSGLTEDFEPRWGQDCIDVFWEGSVDSDWNTSANWSNGTVPTSFESVAIKPSGFQPVIDASSNVEINELLVVNQAELDVFGVLKANIELINNGKITFKSIASGSGQFDEFNQSITGRGSIVSERFIPAADNNMRAFRLLSSSVTSTGSIRENWQEGVNNLSYQNLPVGNENPNPGFGTHITGSSTGQNGFDATETGTKSLFYFNRNTQLWNAIDNTDVHSLIAGEPWLLMVRGDRSTNLNSNTAVGNNTVLRVEGDLYTGDYTLGTSELDQTDDLLNLIGNPYQAVLDYNQVLRTGLTDYLYVWDASIGGINGVGGYVTVELPSGDETVVAPGLGSSDASQFIAPGQAFFVQNDDDPATDTSITMSEVHKAVNESEVTVFNTYPHFYLNSSLFKTSDYQAGESACDAIGLRFNNSYTTLADSEDAVKFFNTNESYAIINNGFRSIDKQDLPLDGHEIPLHISNYTETNYTLTFQIGNQPSTIALKLKDNYLNTESPISSNMAYSFSVDQNIPESLATDRFSLVLNNTFLNIQNNDPQGDIMITPNPNYNGHFKIIAPNLSGYANVEIINTLGQRVLIETLKMDNQEIKIFVEDLVTGVYVLRFSQGEFIHSVKLIVK